MKGKALQYKGWIHLPEIISVEEARSLCTLLSTNKAKPRPVVVIVNKETVRFDSIREASTGLSICRRKIREILDKSITHYRNLEFIHK